MFCLDYKKEDKRSNGVTNTDYLGWEIEPGIRYFITPNLNTTVAYFDGGKQAIRHEEYDTKKQITTSNYVCM